MAAGEIFVNIRLPIIAFCEGDLAVFRSTDEMLSYVERPDIENGLWEAFDADGTPLELVVSDSTPSKWQTFIGSEPSDVGVVLREAVDPERLAAHLLEYFLLLDENQRANLLAKSIGELKAMPLSELVELANRIYA